MTKKEKEAGVCTRKRLREGGREIEKEVLLLTISESNAVTA